MADSSISNDWVDELLACPSIEKQIDFLRRDGFTGRSGLRRLLDYTEDSARNSPPQARRLTLLCEEVARQINAPDLIPQAIYLRAQTYVLSGEPRVASNLIRTARTQFLDLDQPVDALRTDVGLMHTLTMLGEYPAALDVADSTLVQVDHALENADAESARALQAIRAKMHINQGPALSETGRFDEALTAYAQAESIYESLQMSDELVLVLSNRGVALRYLGRVDEALAAYQRAIALLPNSGYFYALTLMNIGDAHLLLGDYRASLRAYADARQEFIAQESDVYRHICTTHMADAYLALNLFPEAESLYAEAAAALHSTDLHYYLGKALWGLGAVQLAQGNPNAAATALTRAADIFAQIENTPLRASVLLEQAANQIVQNDQAAAIRTTQQALDLLGDEERAQWPVQKVYAHLRMADLLLPDIADAEAHLQQAHELLKAITLPHLHYRLLQRMGHLRRLQGRDDEAQALLERAIEIVEQLRTSLVNESMHVSFQQDKMAAYEDLIQLHLDRTYSQQEREEELQRTFDLIERAKSRALVERMSGVANIPIDGDADEELMARRRQIQARLNAIYTDLLRQETDDPDKPEMRGDRAIRMAQLNRQATALEHELARVRLQENTDREVTKPFTQTLSTRQIQQKLTDDLTVISYHIAGDEIVAFVITHQSVQVVRNLGTTAQVEGELAKLNTQWNHFRVRHSYIERHLLRLEQNTQLLLHRLYCVLMAPLEPLLAPIPSGAIRKLVIVPHGLLHQVPFQALFDGERYLIEYVELSYAPSATVLTLCQQQPPRQSKNVLAMAVSDPAIPAVEAEAKAIAQAVSHSSTLLNSEATLAALRANVANYQVLHFACHGLYRADNPIFSALKLYDGWLTATETAELDLAGALVVLSACESGRGKVLAGDETIGLARACLGAGASALVVSQWLVQDDTGAILMAEWYARLARGREASNALRAAQLALKSSHPHPYYWAPFVLMGSRAKIFDRPVGVKS